MNSNNRATDISSVSAGTGIAMAAILTSLGYMAYIRNCDKNKKSRRYSNKYPPFAPGTALHHIQACTTADYPWFLLRSARHLQTHIFRLKLGLRVFAVGQPTTLRSILMDPSTIKPDLFYKTHERVAGGPTLNTTNGEEWHEKRKAVARAFSPKQVKRMTKVALDKTESWIQGLKLKQQQDDYSDEEASSFDVAQEILDIVLSALTETALEYEMSKDEKEHFVTEMNLALIEYDQKTAANPFRNIIGFLLPERRRADAAVVNVRNMVLKIMNEYEKKECTIDGSLIQLIMKSKVFPTEREKATELVNFLIAGHDTTGYSIAWILISLAKHPDEQSKLRDALRGMSPDDWSHCEQLLRVIKEGMRLHPVGASIRKIGRDIATNNKDEILPKGSICLLTYILLFRNPNVFTDPDTFDPSRWESPSKEMTEAMQPFGLGKQNCVGQLLAKSETQAIIARIISEFELTVVEEGTVDFFLTLKPVGARVKW